ncbi:MAG: peptidoglycan DD-metalloendopeptidase family protein [Oscillospiraceae bacterium]|nr:peptidoglycan DD-metalloendopeptidase family protein [Oscillospiraceae bacterium]
MMRKLFTKLMVIVLIMAMILPYTALAAESGPAWTNLPEIAPYGFDPDMLSQMGEFDAFSGNQYIDISQLDMELNELSELFPEALEELMRERDSRAREMDEFSMLLSEGRGFSDLTENERSLIFIQLDIAYGARNVTSQLFDIMERDGFTLAESIELIMIMSGGLFDYAEAQMIIEAMPSIHERMMEVRRFEWFAQRFDISDEVNSRRLVNRPFMLTNEPGESRTETRLLDVQDLLSANRSSRHYSFIEAAQLDTAHAAFTNASAFNEARRMFLNNHSTAEIEAAFALGAALQAEPQTFMLEPCTYCAGSARLVAEQEDVLINEQIGPPYPPLAQNRSTAMQYPFDMEAVMSVAGIDAAELYQILEYGMEILNYGFAPMSAPSHDSIVVNPFNLRFNANESVSLNTGAAMFRMNVLNLPGRNGFDLNLDIVYNSSKAVWDLTNHFLNGVGDIGVGWRFDLPYILDNTLYVPGRGTFELGWNGLLSHHTLNDMQLSHYSGFVSGPLQSNQRLSFYNGTTYYFNQGRIIGMRDRFGNTIRFEYAAGWVPSWVLTRIVDTNGSEINIQNQWQPLTQTSTITITGSDGSNFAMTLSRHLVLGESWCSFNEEFFLSQISTFVLTSVQDQVGAVTSFGYTSKEYTNPSSPPPHNQYVRLLSIVLLNRVTYPSGAQMRFEYSLHTFGFLSRRHCSCYGLCFGAWRCSRNCHCSSGHCLWYCSCSGYYFTITRQVYKVSARSLIYNQREYLRTTFSYHGSAFDLTIHWWMNSLYSTTVTQNNGLRTVYTFNNLHLNISQRTYNAGNILLSEQSITYNNDKLPTRIELTEHRGNFSRNTRRDFTYNQRGQVIQSVSPLANGSTDVRYRIDYTFDARFGLPLTRISRPDAHTTIRKQNVLSWDGRNIIRTYVYENNVRQSRTDFLHDAFGNVTEIREFPDSRGADFIATQITYNSGTMPQTIRTTNVRNPDGTLVGGTGIVERRFTYDTMWRTLSETDPNGYITRWQYDRVGRVTRIDFPTGGHVTYAYNDQQNTVTHRTVLGAIYAYRYDGFGNLLTITNPNGIEILTNTYDNRMRLIETRNAQGIASSQRTTFAYDIFDRVVTTDRLNAGGVVLHRETTVYHDVYDWQGNSQIVTTVLDGGGAPSIQPSIQTFVQYDRFGHRTQEGTVGGRIVNYTHDLAGRVTREWSLGVDNRFTYNVFGVTSVRNIAGRTAHNTYDSMGRLVTSTDFMGNIQRFTYDALGRLIEQRVPFEQVGNVIQYATTRYFYDRNGNLTRTATLVNLPGTAQIWATTENTFRHNRLMSSQTGGANGIRTEYTYDLAGNILTKRVGGATTTYTYNNRGQLTQIRDALGQIETFTYDQNGLLLTRTDRNGTQFRMTYDTLGRLVREDATRNGAVVNHRAYIFHGTGALFSETNGSHTITYRYDAQGRVIRQEETGGVVKTFQYNAANNVTRATTAINGHVHINNTYAYDSAQRLQSVRSANGGLLSSYTYDFNGNRTRVTLGNGVITEYTYNLANLVTSVTNRQGNDVLSSYVYTYYLDGNTSRVVGSDRTMIYTYDLARRLIREEAVLEATTTPQEPTLTFHAYGEGTFAGAESITIPVTFGEPLDLSAVTAYVDYVDAQGQLAFWGWFTDAQLDGSGRSRNGHRRPLLADNPIAVPVSFTQAEFEALAVGGNIDLYAIWSLWGDVDDDGVVDVFDFQILTQYVRGSFPGYYAIVHAAADVVRDGVIDQVDVDVLMDYVVGMAPRPVLGQRPPPPVTASTWEDLRNVINGAPVLMPLTIQISDSFAAPSGTAGDAIVIPERRNIILVGVDGDMRTLTQTNDGQRHFIVNGGLTLGQNITLCGGATGPAALSHSREFEAMLSESALAEIEALLSELASSRRTESDVDALVEALAEAMRSGGAEALNAGGTGSGGVRVNAGGTFTMNAGSVIENRHGLTSGGAVELGSPSGGRATFNMTGGTIRNNSASTGGGVSIGGNSRMNMSGGMITNNSAMVGGGVLVLSTIASGQGLNMTDGSITNNHADGISFLGIYGGGISTFGGGSANFHVGPDAVVAGNTPDDICPPAPGGHAFDTYYSHELAVNAEYYISWDAMNAAVAAERGTAAVQSAAMSATGTITIIRAYTFDNRGNRLTMTVTGDETYTVTYTYDLNNRLLSTVRTGTDPQTATYTYDRNGNQLTRVTAGQTETRTYNAFNQLTQVLNGAALVSVTYVYRADGLRHSKTSNHARVTHIWNGAHIVLELNASNAVINRFYRGGGGRLLRSEHHGWYLFNARGDVVQRVDNAGELLHTYHYDAFGVERDQDEGNTNPFRFAGEYYDWETGTIYLRFRCYNPATGRFTQEDPYWGIHNMQSSVAAVLQAANLYVYVMNNPEMFIDPWGLFARAAWEAAWERAANAAKAIADAARAAMRAAADALRVVQIGGYDYVFPVDIETNTRIDWYHRGGRDAVDIFAPEGTLVFAITSGTLIRVQNDVSRAAGNRATLQLLGDDGMIYFHTHLAPNSPSDFGFATVGSGGTVRVEAGQPIGRLGNWGAADNTPPHLHISATPFVGANAPVDQHVGNWMRTLVGQLLG